VQRWTAACNVAQVPTPCWIWVKENRVEKKDMPRQAIRPALPCPTGRAPSDANADLPCKVSQHGLMQYGVLGENDMTLFANKNKNKNSKVTENALDWRPG